jgi:hypothetical protein
MQFNESKSAEIVREIIREELGKGREQRLRDSWDNVVENLYQRLPSGDYGRGDVRRVIEEVIRNFIRSEDAPGS